MVCKSAADTLFPCNVATRATRFAIAGINAGNADAVIATGADGIAVISALSLAGDPQAAARDLRAIVEAALAKRQAA